MNGVQASATDWLEIVRGEFQEIPDSTSRSHKYSAYGAWMQPPATSSSTSWWRHGF